MPAKKSSAVKKTAPKSATRKPSTNKKAGNPKGRKQKDGADVFAYWWRLLAPGFPEPVREFQFARVAMKRNWKADFCWPGHRVIVEIDGGQWLANGGRHNRDSDREKLNAANLLEYAVLRYSTQMMDSDPVTMIEQVKQLLETRG